MNPTCINCRALLHPPKTPGAVVRVRLHRISVERGRPLARGAGADRWGPIEYRIALDHPLFDDASLVWDNHSHAELEKAKFHRADPNDKEANQAAIEACLQSAYGPPTWRTETDHMKREYSSRWSLEGVDNAIEAYNGDAFVVVEAFVLRSSGGGLRPGSSRLSTAAWQRVVAVLDACGRR